MHGYCGVQLSKIDGLWQVGTMGRLDLDPCKLAKICVWKLEYGEGLYLGTGGCAMKNCLGKLIIKTKQKCIALLMLITYNAASSYIFTLYSAV